MHIRLADRNDMKAVRAVYEPYVLHTNYTFEYEVPDVAEMQRRYDHVTEYFPWLVLEDTGETGGYAYAELAFARAAYQWNVDSAVYLKEDWQGQGAAQVLYGCLEDFLKRQGFYTIYALVTSANERSRCFHEKMGYEQEAVFHRTGYKRGEWLDVTWYTKRLKPVQDNPAATVAFRELPEPQVAEVLQHWNEKLVGR